MRKRSTHRHLKENDIHRLRNVTRTCCVEGSFWTVAQNLSVADKWQNLQVDHAEKIFVYRQKQSEVSENELSPLPDSGLGMSRQRYVVFTT